MFPDVRAAIIKFYAYYYCMMMIVAIFVINLVIGIIVEAEKLLLFNNVN